MTKIQGCLFHHHEHAVIGCLLLVREEGIHHRKCLAIFYGIDLVGVDLAEVDLAEVDLMGS